MPPASVAPVRTAISKHSRDLDGAPVHDRGEDLVLDLLVDHHDGGPDDRVGYTQGYNVQAVVTEEQIVLAAEVNASSPDFGHLAPMVKAAKRELQTIGVTETPGVAVADSGYWNEQQMDQVVANEHVQVLIPPDAGKRQTPRRGWLGGRYTAMRLALATEYGDRLYRRRKAMVEPVFAQTKHNRRINQFQRRGRSAALSEWRLITATHNLLKLHKHQIATAAA